MLIIQTNILKDDPEFSLLADETRDVNNQEH